MSADELTAQAVIPQSLAGVEAASSTRLPFGVADPVRFQSIYEAGTLSFSDNRRINGLRLRMDGERGAMTGKQFLTIDVWISTSHVTASGANENFDQNHGNDRVKVLNFEKVALPTLSQLDPALLPRPFELELDFDRINGHATNYGLTPVRVGRELPKSLVVDIHVLEQPGGSYWMDSPFMCTSPSQTFSDPAEDCLTGAGQALQLSSSDDIRAGGVVIYEVRDLPADAPFAVIISPQAGGQIAGLPLPLHLGGPTPILGLPADGCYVHVNPLAVRSTAADAAGFGSLSFMVPADLNLVDQQIYSQAFCLDISANLLGIVTSHRLSSLICGPLRVARVVGSGPGFGGSGAVTLGAALVMELY
ncbi:MAG: hypothetical protein ACYTG5_11685 [Planctomycetota bacterium]|jgi:hypothetical protein